MMQQVDLPLGEPAALVLRLIDTFAQALALRGATPPPAGDVQIKIEGAWADGAETGRRMDPPVRPATSTTSAGIRVVFNEALGADGVRRRPALRPGRYDLAIESQFYQTARLTRVALPDSVPIDVPLSPAWNYPFPTSKPANPERGFSLLRGSALRPDGRGVAGAVIACEAEGLSYTTDASGAWAFAFPPGWRGGDVVLTLTWPGKAAAPLAPATLNPGQKLTLPIARIRGRVLTAKGQPAPGTRIFLARMSDEAVTTDASGRFALVIPPDTASHSIGVSAAGLDGSATARVALPPAPDSELTLKLTADDAPQGVTAHA